MLTAIGRAAARRAFVPSRSAAPRLTAQLLRGPGEGAIALPLASVRALAVSAWLRSPAKAASSSRGSKAKKTTAAGKKKKATKKPAAKKKKPAKKSTKKVAKKAAKKKKKAVKKPAKKKKAVKKAKKQTPEQKEKAATKELKNLALLKGPDLLPDTSWTVYLSNNYGKGEGRLRDKVKEIADNFAKLPEAEKERLNSAASANKATNKVTREKWVASYPPEAIYAANLARRRLARKYAKTRTYLIHDDRQIKRSRSAFSLFITSRFSQANESTATARDTFRALAEQWKSLPEQEKQRYKDASAKEAERAHGQFERIREKSKAYVKAQRLSAQKVPS